MVTSLAGAGTYALLALTTAGDIAPNWPIGLLCELGGLVGGHLGARLQPHHPETALRLLLRVLALSLSGLHVIEALH